jgi:hypothetical protein
MATDRKKFRGHLSPAFFPLSCLVSLLQSEQRTVMDVSGNIRTEMGSTIDQKMVAVTCDALYDTTP